MSEDVLIYTPVEVRRCRRNRRRLIIVDATGRVLLRTEAVSLWHQDVAERFARALNESAEGGKISLRQGVYGYSNMESAA